MFHSCPSLPSQSSVPLGTPFSTMGHVGGYPRISYFPTCIWDRWDSPMESHVYHCTGQSYVSVLSHCPTWDTWDSPMESHVYHCTGQSYVSVLSHCPTWDGWTVLWNPMCTTVQANPMCPSYPTVLRGTHGTVLWNPMCTTAQANPMCPSYPTVLRGTDGTVL